ncbi:hypothetical protein FRB94_003119 [Tulasnella sp. JGI-2019a]|nr:hypothetical protein FRB94_003119 [Tulasnella sp. JGI-2019a]
MDTAQQLRHVRFDAFCILIPDEPCEQEASTGIWRALAPVKSLLPQGWVGSLGGHARRTSSSERSAGEDGVMISPKAGRLSLNGRGRRLSAASQPPVDAPRPCLKTAQSSPAVPGAFPSSPLTETHFTQSIASFPTSSSLSSTPLATEPLHECCVTCNPTTDRAVQLGSAYRIPWTSGAAAKKKRDDSEQQRDILDGFKSNCQAWRDVLPDEEEQDGYAKPYEDEDDEAVSLSDDEDESSDSKHRKGKFGVLSKLDGITASTPRHRRDNKDWQPDRYYDTQENEDDLFPLPSPVASPRHGSPSVSSANLVDEVQAFGFSTLPTIPGSLTTSRNGSEDGRHSASPSPLRNFFSENGDGYDEALDDTIGKASSLRVPLNTSPSKANSNLPKPQPRISIPPSSSQSSLVDQSLAPGSVLSSAHQLSVLSAVPSQQQPARFTPDSMSKPKIKGGPPASPSITSSSSRSVSSTGSSGRMYQSGGFVPPALPTSGRRSVGKIMLERAEGTGRSPLVAPNAPISHDRKRESAPSAGRGMASSSGSVGAVPTSSTSHARPMEPPNPKMPTYSAAQREVVVIASSRMSGSTERGGARQSSDTVRTRLVPQEKTLPTPPLLPTPPAVPQRQMSSNSWVSTDPVGTPTGSGAASDRSDRTPSSTPKQRSVDEFGREIDGGPLQLVETITPRIAVRQSTRSQTLPPLPESGASYTLSVTGGSEKQLPQPPRSSRAPQSVLRKAGSGTDLRVNNQYQQQSQQQQRHSHHQVQKPSPPPATDRLSAAAAAAVAPAPADAEVHRSRSSSIRRLWRGVLGGSIGGTGSSGGTGVMGVHVR